MDYLGIVVFRITRYAQRLIRSEREDIESTAQVASIAFFDHINIYIKVLGK